MKKKVLVLGGVHVDIFADYDRHDKKRLDRVGELHYAIGGTAHNIAYILSENKCLVTLYSILNSNSYSTIWIKRELKYTDILPAFQTEYDTYVENGFVAIRKSGVLEQAVTSSYLSKARINKNFVDKLCKDKSLAIMDCNFESTQLITLASICKSNNLPIIVAATSDSKVKRILPVLDYYFIDMLVMNELEALSFFDVKEVNEITINMLPKNIGQLVITLGENGHLLMDHMKIEAFKAPTIKEILSTSGAGDALLSAIVLYFTQSGKMDVHKAYPLICEIVGISLSQPGTYLKPTRKRLSFKFLLYWVCFFLLIICATIYCIVQERFDFMLYLSIIGFIFSFTQTIRAELKE